MADPEGNNQLSPQPNIPTDDASIDENSASNSANNSLIGKVKSRVSSILPNTITKWFSPASKNKNNNEVLNGSSTDSRGSAGRKRRIELDDDVYDDEGRELGDDINYEEEAAIADEIAEHDTDQEFRRASYDMQMLQQRSYPADGEEDEELDEDEDVVGLPKWSHQHQHDNKNNNCSDGNVAGFGLNKRNQMQPNTKPVRQPPNKRTRISTDFSYGRDSPLLLQQRRQLVASTPATAAYPRTNAMQGLHGARVGSSQRNRSYLNLYGSQNRKEPAFNFESANATNINTNDSITVNDALNKISSRRTLNIPHLKRPALSSLQGSLNLADKGGLLRTSTTIHERHNMDTEDGSVSTSLARNNIERDDPNCYNGPVNNNNNVKLSVQTDMMMSSSSSASHKKLQNGKSVASAPYVSEHGSDDSNEEASRRNNNNDALSTNAQHLGTGMYNLRTDSQRTNSSTGNSRTSSFSNGLNFYAHLQGRKSLFAGYTQPAQTTLNNSTLSLTSLNRRQFNSSIYGSTSALSDSRLLNTFSPFYKGRTMYGGASAYNKYNSSGTLSSLGRGTGTGAGASCTNITPTVIRPNSSQSTTSSGVSAKEGDAGESTVGISSTAQRILALINDCSSPLNDAKKMAVNLRSQSHWKNMRRLNESDLQSSRSARLSMQQRTPYTRPTLGAQPISEVSSLQNGNDKTPLPPIRELQVPSMAQLLKLRKFQDTTDRVRNIARQGQQAEYSLPQAVTENKADSQSPQQTQQKHTNKIRHKTTSSARITSTNKSSGIEDEPLPPVNLPDIQFPTMVGAPKFADIRLPVQNVNVPEFGTDSASKPGTSSVSVSKSAELKNFAFKSTGGGGGTLQNTSNDEKNFKFSAPLSVSDSSTPKLPTGNNMPEVNFNFSPPIVVAKNTTSNATVAMPNATATATATTMNTTTSIFSKTQMPTAAIPQLRSGSVLDVLKPKQAVNTTGNDTNGDKSSATVVGAVEKITSKPIGFGDQFKMPSSEWECSVCMLRNKQEAKKCVACETPNSNDAAQIKVTSTNMTITNTTSTNVMSSASVVIPQSGALNNFGDQFKKSSTEWECDACMLRNKEADSKCVACETPRPGAIAPVQIVAPLVAASGNTFGSAFKPKPDTWECSTCMIVNKNTDDMCVACQTSKPGASTTPAASSATLSTPVAAATQFKFGFGTETKSTPQPDAGFKTLAAAQKASKWSCDACLAQNDAEHQKCLCCEQPKPGASTVVADDSSSKTKTNITFGQSAVSNFKFGFANVSSDAATTTTTTTTTATATTSAAPIAGGFIFGAPKATNSTSATTSSAGFKFGNFSGKTDAKTDNNTSTATNTNKNKTTQEGFIFGSNLTTATAAKKDDDEPAAKKSQNVNFNFSQHKESANPSGIAVSTTTTTTELSGGFRFGAPQSNMNNSTGFAFKPMTTSTTTSSATSSASTSSPSLATSSSSSSSSLSSSSAAAAAPASTGAGVKTNIFGSALSNNIAAAPTTSTNTFGSIAAANNQTMNTVFGGTGTQLNPNSSSGSGSNVIAAPSTVANNSFMFAAPNSQSNTTSSAGLFNVATTTTTSSSFVFGSSCQLGKTNQPMANAASVSRPSVPFVFGSTSLAGVGAGTGAGDNDNLNKNSTTTAAGSGATLFGFQNTNAASVLPVSNVPETNITSPFNSNFGAPAVAESSGIFGNVAPQMSGTQPSTTMSTFGGISAANASTSNPNAANAIKTATVAPFGVTSFGTNTNKPFNFGATNATQIGAGTGIGIGAGGGNGLGTSTATGNLFNFSGPRPFLPNGPSPFRFTSTDTVADLNYIEISDIKVSSGVSKRYFDFSGIYGGNINQTTPNAAPFQFNAGAPASTNIFAINPTTNTGAQNAQQTRRKIRTATRRFPPR